MNLSIFEVAFSLACTAVLAMYIYFLYKQLNRNVFINKNFTLSLIAIAIVTAAVILTIQSNIVVSLGMVGALSIVRFRTAVKDPMDLVFLFWSISIGIICGAGFAMIAVIMSVMVTVVVTVLSKLQTQRLSQILVVNSVSVELEKAIMDTVRKHSKSYKTLSRTVSAKAFDLSVEVWAAAEAELVKELSGIEGVEYTSLVSHEGDISM